MMVIIFLIGSFIIIIMTINGSLSCLTRPSSYSENLIRKIDILRINHWWFNICLNHRSIKRAYVVVHMLMMKDTKVSLLNMTYYKDGTRRIWWSSECVRWLSYGWIAWRGSFLRLSDGWKVLSSVFLSWAGSSSCWSIWMSLHPKKDRFSISTFSWPSEDFPKPECCIGVWKSPDVTTSENIG